MSENSDYKIYMKMKKPQLVEKCEKLGLKAYGKKENLVLSILSAESRKKEAKKNTSSVDQFFSTKSTKKDGDSMEVRFSEPNNVPYIQLKNAKVVFSINTENTIKGFKYLSINCRFPKKKGVEETVNFVTNMYFSKIPKEAKKIIPGKTIKFLKKCFEKFVDEEGFFPRENLEKLSKKLCK